MYDKVSDNVNKEPNGSLDKVFTFSESLILAQDERWRRA